MNFMTLTDREKLIQLIVSLNAVYAFRTTEVSDQASDKDDLRQVIRTTAFEFLPSLTEQDYKKLLSDLRENELNVQTTLEFLVKHPH